MRIALVGPFLDDRHEVAMYLKQGHGFKRVRLEEAVERIFRFILPRKRWTKVPWQDKKHLYDAMYRINPDYWLAYLEKRLETTTNDVVLEDARYVTEVEYLRKLNFIVVRVTSNKKRNKNSIANSLMGAGEGTITVHESFNSDPAAGYRVDYAIVNDSKESMKRAVDALMNSLTLRNK